MILIYQIIVKNDQSQKSIATIWSTTVYLLFFGINVAYQIHAWRFKVLVLFYLANKQSSCSKCLNFCFPRVYSNFQLFSRIMVIFMTATCKVYHQNIFWLSMVFILQVNLAVEASKVVCNQCYQLLILDNLKT